MQNQLIENNLTKSEELEFESKQNSFLQTNIGKAINNGVNFGLRIVLPDVVEDDIIEIKDALINNGFKEATEVAIDKAINLGKSFLGIFSGEFDSIAQIKKAIEKGGLIDTMSDVLDTAITWAQKSKLISSSTAKMIKSGKKEIMKNIKNGIDSTLEDQVEAVEKIDKYIEKWYKYYEEENFINMEYQYKKITEYMEKVVPIEKTINAAKEVETLHEYIKENGKSFELSEEQKELCKMLSNY